MWLANCVRTQEPLANHTTFRIGGPAEWFAEPSTVDELGVLLRDAERMGIPVCAIGGGTNLLVSDRGVSGLTVHLGKAFRTIDVLSAPDDVDVRVRCGAAVSTQRLVGLAAEQGWAEIGRASCRERV